jgi:nucleoid-associated protein YgaU
MASLQQGRGALAFLGAVAIAGAVGAYGVANWSSREARVAPSSAGPTPQPAPAQQAATTAPPTPAQPQPAPASAPEMPVPSFDVVRVEPNGESVIAGRGAPGATIEMLRNGQVHARAAADQVGLFAIVPPALPPGSHQVMLQSIAPDGIRQRSKESVTIIISEGRNTRPLVALTAPDKPTVLLSNPEIPEQKSAEAPAQPHAPAPQRPEQQASAQPVPSPAQPAPRPEVKIVTIDAEQGGRLFVSGQGAPGASVRLYLNETFIAPGQVGGDGKISFAIGRGVRPGDYQVRIDEVDPVSGAVKSRAEVALNVPVPVAVAAAAPPASLPPAPVPPAMPQPPTTGAAGPAPAAAAPASPAVPANTGAPAVPANSKFASTAPDLPVGTVLIPDVNTAIVSRGDSLWRISQRIYGDGYRFTVIYGANQKQIRDPNMIYPGQVFVLPADPAKTP